MRHLNLLPRERRDSLRREVALTAATRFLTAIMFGLIMLTVVGLAAGGVMWTLLFVGARSTEVGLEVQLAQYNTVRAEVVQRNTVLKLIDGIGQSRVVWSDLLVSWLQTIPPGATVDVLEFAADDQSIYFSGTAATRASLVVFEDRLRQLPWALSVDAPRANLLRRYDPNYTFSLQVTPDGKDAL